MAQLFFKGSAVQVEPTTVMAVTARIASPINPAAGQEWPFGESTECTVH